MSIMVLAVMLVAGVCLGLLTASTSVPRIRLVPSISVGVLLVIVVVTLLVYSTTRAELPFFGAFGGLVLLLVFVASSTLYSGALWNRIGMDPTVSYWGWVWRDFTHANYLRKQHEVMVEAIKQDENALLH